MLRRTPRPSLRPFVQTVWLQDEADGGGPLRRERVLPTGDMHLVFRLTEHPLVLAGDVGDSAGTVVGCAVIGGARAVHYLRQVGQPLRSVGAQLRPGAAAALLGVPAHVLAERHTRLEDVWGRRAGEWRERLAEARTPGETLDRFERLLESRLMASAGLPPAVASALGWLRDHGEIAPLVERSGYSHRHFIALFRGAVGLSPKVYGRLLRFQRALTLAVARPQRPLAEVALAAGYSDQAHLGREFLRIAGVTPGALRALRPEHPHHVPERGVKSIQDAPATGGGESGHDHP